MAEIDVEFVGGRPWGFHTELPHGLTNPEDWRRHTG
jgi:hypothetical protein